MLRESYSDFSTKNKVISIHRSTQDIGAAFLMNTLSQEAKVNFIEKAVVVMRDFYQTCDEKQDQKNLILLIPHLIALLNLLQNIDCTHDTQSKHEANIQLILGNIYYKWTSNMVYACNCFKKVLDKNNISQHLAPNVLATLLKDLGNVSAVTNYPKESIKYSEKSIDACASLAESNLIVADNLHTIGTAYRKMNNFEKASEYFNRALTIALHTKEEGAKELITEIYSQLGYLYLVKYMHKKEALIASNYYDDALKTLGASELLYVKNKSIPKEVSCSTCRQLWKYSLFLIFHGLDYTKANTWLKEALYIMENRCPENLYIKGRISGAMGEISLRQNNLVLAEDQLTESINLIGIMLGEQSSWVQRVSLSESRIRLGKFKEGYDDSIQVISLNGRENNELHNLAYFTALYHAGFAQYKLGNHTKSIEYFGFCLKIEN